MSPPPSRGAVVVLGSTNTDLTVRVDRLPLPGETVLGGSLLETGGGKGANQAIAAARAGAKVLFVGAIGNDRSGAARHEELSREGINLECLQTVADQPSGVALILVSATGENQIAVAPGANGSVTEGMIADLPAGVFHPGNILVCQLETPTGAVQAALARARASGMKTILNPAPAHAVVADPAWLSLIDTLILNEHELATISGRSSVRADECGSLLADWHERGVGTIIVTLGSAGYLLSANGSLHARPAFAVEAVDTVGAGDTFVGALAARWVEGDSLESAADWASAAAALAVTQAGAQRSIPQRAQVDAFLARVRSQPS